MDTPANDFARPAQVLERALLWAIRAWVIGLTRRLPVEDRIEAMLARLGVPEASGALFAMMWVISRSATRQITIDCVCCKGTSRDERMVLDVLALYQQDRPFEALLRLRAMLSPNAALAAGENAAQLAASLSAAGCLLEPPSPGTDRYALVGDALMAEPAPTLH